MGVWGGVTGAAVGSVAWLVAMAFLSHDWKVGLFTLLLALAVVAVFGRWTFKYPKKRFLVLAGMVVLLTAHCLFMYWLRVEDWRAGTNITPEELARQKKIVVAAVGGMVMILVAQMLLMHWLSSRPRRASFR